MFALLHIHTQSHRLTEVRALPGETVRLLSYIPHCPHLTNTKIEKNITIELQVLTLNRHHCSTKSASMTPQAATAHS